MIPVSFWKSRQKPWPPKTSVFVPVTTAPVGTPNSSSTTIVNVVSKLRRVFVPGIGLLPAIVAVPSSTKVPE
jgi:hypothetical protein